MVRKVSGIRRKDMKCMVSMGPNGVYRFFLGLWVGDISKKMHDQELHVSVWPDFMPFCTRYRSHFPLIVSSIFSDSGLVISSRLWSRDISMETGKGTVSAY